MNLANTSKNRNARMELNEVYFWTCTIVDWKPLLTKDRFKDIIISELIWLKCNLKIAVYGYVIMLNHVHFLWELLDKNGKELPSASFNKWTASNFLKTLRVHYPKAVSYFEVSLVDRRHRFWQRDSLAIKIVSREMFEQKLDYIHNNPLHERWNLAKRPEEYRWSSARFYEKGYDEFGIMTHYLDRL